MAIKQLYKIAIQTPQQSTELLLTQDAVTVGRSADCEVSVESVGISRRHLKIENKDGELVITDLGSTNGTIYQGIKLKPNLPVPYSNGIIYLGPVSDGNKIELIAESATKENTRTLTQAKIAAEAARVAAIKEKERERELSRINSLVSEPPKEKSRVSVVADKPKYNYEKSVTMHPPAVENIISAPVEESILEGMREEIRRLRAEQEDLENAKREVEAQRNSAEDQLRQIRRDVEEFESRLAAMRERTQEEEDRLKRRMGEIAEKLKTEETIYQNRRDELSHERDALHKLERQTAEERSALEKEHIKLQDELEKARSKSESELETARARHSSEMEKLTLEQKKERRRLEDEQDTLVERLKDEHDKLKRKLNQEAAAEKQRCEDEIIAARRKYEDDAKELRKKNEEELATAKRKFESESIALQERYAQEAAAEHKRIMEELEADRKRLTKEQRQYAEEVADTKEKLRDELEKIQTETRSETKRLTDELADHLERTTKERAEIDDLHKAHVSEVKEREEHLKAEFDAVEKKHRIQLETLVASIALKEAQEQKIIEQRKTEKVVAERELADARQVLENTKKELATLHKNVLSVQEQLAEREKEEKSVLDSIAKHEAQQAKLKQEIQKFNDTLSEKRGTLAKLQDELEEQQKKNKLDRETAVREAEEIKRKIIAEGEAEAEAHREQSDDELAKELTKLRQEAAAKAKADEGDWAMEMSRRKSRETEEMNLWFAEEKRKIQDRLSGDLNNFVETVTSAAMAKMNQDSRFSSLTHEFHKKFSEELRHSLTSGDGEFVAHFNPDRKKDTQTFWVKSAVAAVLIVGVALLARVAPDYIREAAEQRRVSKDDGATGEWIKKIQAERDQRLALHLETKSDFQFTYASNVLYNEGYLEMKMDTKMQSEWVRELNLFITGEKAMGMDDEAVVDYIRVEHALFVDLADKKAHMNGVNKDDFIKEMEKLSVQATADLVKVLKTRILPKSDRARQSTAEHKWRQIRELEQNFYVRHMQAAERRPAAK